MSAHNELGKAGEDAAADCLAAKGYTILERNWRRNKLELDIVAYKDGVIVVVEVKTRTSDYVDPIAAVTKAKIARTVRAANVYLQLFALPHEVQFDVVAVTMHDGKVEIEHIPDAFYPAAKVYR